MFEECTAEGYTFLMNEASKSLKKVKLERQPTLYRVQSDEQDMQKKAMGDASDSTTQGVVEFRDEKAGVSLDLAAPVNYLAGDTSQNVELGDFLSRPVEIYNIDWAEGFELDSATINVKPWFKFFDNAAIKKKLDNYYMVKCNLKVKFIINASPFYYSAVLVSYEPLTSFNPAPMVRNGKLHLIPESQRPHVYLYPQTNQGAEMTLPFLYHKEWLDVTSSTDLQEMGELSFTSITELLNANSVAGTSCTIQVYAWAEDVELAGPTVALSVQSTEIPIVHSKRYHITHACKDIYFCAKCASTMIYVLQSSEKKVKDKGKVDEYHHEGTISKPASAVARATGLLSTLPTIGPFMTATSVAAGAVSNIASLFGYTDVPVIDDVHEFKNQPFPQFASTDIGIAIEKATLDSKNELAIDPKVVGVNIPDELNLSSFVQRESYIAKVNWDAADVVDTLLYNFVVTPSIRSNLSSSWQKIQYNTPMSYAANAFRYWRGDIKFRFKFICSKYHRGRVRISWDPHGDIAATADSTTQVYTKIVDISEVTDVCFNVPYTQPTSYLNVQTDYQTDEHQAAALPAAQPHGNGILTIRVLTEQTSPVASADVIIAMFVSGGENLEFACPDSITNTLSPYVVQSSEIAYDAESEESVQMGLAPSSAYPGLNLVYMGETIKSLRTLMRRTSYLGFKKFNYNYSGLDSYVVLRSVHRRVPLIPGYDPNGPQSATGLISTIAEPYNFVNWSYMSYFSLPFVGKRGSVHWHCNVRSNYDVNDLSITRGNDKVYANLSTGNYSSSVASAGNSNEVARNSTIYKMRGSTGMSVTNQGTQRAVSLAAPMYSKFKFISNDILTNTLGAAVDETTDDSISVSGVITPSNQGANTDGGFDFYCSAGTDYTPVFFLNIPVMYFYLNTPTATP